MTEIIINQIQSAGHIHLNRPKALNALTINMVRRMHEALIAWEEDRSVEAIVVTGEGGRAFCAGGDVKAAYHAGKSGAIGDGSLAGDFFREEYKLNYEIANYAKPYISWLNGITMGGGVGISIMGSHRIVSEHLKFAMPETAIGLFPDVGSSYFLSRLGSVGTLLALTGYPLDAAAALSLGIGTHFVPREKGAGIVDRIGAEGVDRALSALSQPAPDSDSVDALRSLADRCFGSFKLEQILDSLDSAIQDSELGEMAKKMRDTLRQRSPTSLLITLEQLRRGRDLSLHDCLVMEYRMSQACMAGHDFFEGIRAMLIDKDYAPKWSPATFAEVDDELVAKHFKELGPRELQLP